MLLFDRLSCALAGTKVNDKGTKAALKECWIVLCGEQGDKSIHSRFNYLGRNFAPLAKGVERLRSVMKEHFLHINPQNVAARPPPAKRRKLVMQE